MAEANRDTNSSHSSASDGSRSLCDQLFDGVSRSVVDLNRKMGRNYCDFSKDGEKRFGYVRHQKRNAQLDVWFRGEPTLAAQYPKLNILARSPTTSGWAAFDSHFKISNSCL